MPGLRTPELDAPPLLRYGLPEYVRRPNPAVATNFLESLGGDFYVRLLTVFCRFVADGNVANREIGLEYRDNQANRYYLSGSGTAVTAGLTRDMCWSWNQGSVLVATDGTHLMPLTPLLLTPTHDFRIVVAAAQVGDQLARIAFTWERFYTTGQPVRYEPSGP